MEYQEGSGTQRQKPGEIYRAVTWVRGSSTGMTTDPVPALTVCEGELQLGSVNICCSNDGVESLHYFGVLELQPSP